MVTIRYFKSAINKEHEVHHVETIGEFLQVVDLTVPELQQLLFFKGDILGEEIDTSNLDFLYITDGDIEVINASDIPLGPALPYIPYIIAAIAFTAAILLEPDTPDLVVSGDNNSQGSTTNRLGASSNEAAIGGRVPDIFGRVTRHTPPLAQVPYRIGVDNQEVEILLLIVGRGKYEIDISEIYDGYTPYDAIPNAQINVYEPGTYPQNGSPNGDVMIGGLITEEIGIYRESNDLNPAELLPPNDLLIDGARWRAVVVSGVLTMTLLNYDDLDISLANEFVVGGNLTLIDVYSHTGDSNYGFVTLDSNENEAVINQNTMNLVNVDGSYVITATSVNTVTLTAPLLPNLAGNVLDGTFDSYTNDTIAKYTYSTYPNRGAYDWYRANGDITDADDRLYTGRKVYSPSVGGSFGGVIGSINIFSGATKVLINLTSDSGFYKVVDGVETVVYATVIFVIEELDVDGNLTGNSITQNVQYSSNDNNKTFSVYKTVEINIPYAHSHVHGRRTTYRDENTGVSNIDKIQWIALYSFEPVSVGMDLGDVTMMHCVIPSNSQSRLIKQRRTNLSLTRKISYYYDDGQLNGAAESRPSDSFHRILTHVALDPKIGRLSIEQVANRSYIDASNELALYFGEVGYMHDIMRKFGYVFDNNNMSFEDTFTIICNAVNCIPYVQNGRYDLFFEREQTESTMQITCRNKLPNSETREDIFFKQYDGIELTYRSEETSVSETIYLPEDRSALNPDRQEVVGIFTETQALVKAHRIRNKQIYHVTNVEFSTDEFGRLIIPGQRIDSPDSTRYVQHSGNTDGYNVYNGEIVEINALTIELSEPVLFTTGEDHYIQFTSINGDNSELILCTEGDDEFQVILDSAPGDALFDGYSRDKTKFTFCSEQLRESIALIPQTIDTRIDNGKETNTISSINYDARYYQYDSEA